MLEYVNQCLREKTLFVRRVLINNFCCGEKRVICYIMIFIIFILVFFFYVELGNVQLNPLPIHGRN